MIKISQKVISYEVVKTPSDEEVSLPSPPPSLPTRPLALPGITYKLKPAEHAYYITITHTEVQGSLRPWELFISTKDTSSTAWIIAFSRLISAVFRKGGDYTFLIEELKAIVDPAGGYWSKEFYPYLSGGYKPSILFEIGELLDYHRNLITKPPSTSILTQVIPNNPPDSPDPLTKGKQCPNCRAFSLIPLDGCDTCLSCGYSKCS